MNFTCQVIDHDGQTHEIRFKSYLPLDEFFALPNLLRQVDDGDMRTYVPLFQVIIEGWDFPGDPADEAAYQKMDAFTIQQIGRQVLAHIQKRTGQDLKN